MLGECRASGRVDASEALAADLPLRPSGNFSPMTSSGGINGRLGERTPVAIDRLGHPNERLPEAAYHSVEEGVPVRPGDPLADAIYRFDLTHDSEPA